MGYTRWADIKDKVPAERRAEIRREAVAELDRVGYAAVRRARELTQKELARELGVTQSAVALLERRTDIQLSTLAKYIRAMGGELEIRAVFPGAAFNLEPPPAASRSVPAKGKTRKRSVSPPRLFADRRGPHAAAASAARS